VAQVWSKFLALALLLALPCKALAEADLAFSDAPFMGLSLGAVVTDKADMQALLPLAAVPDTLGLLGRLKIGYLSESGFSVEGAYTAGPRRTYAVTYASGGGTYTDSYTLYESTFSVEPAFRTPLGPTVAFGAGLEAGYSAYSYSMTSPMSSGESYSSNAYSFSPELKLSAFFGRFGLDLDLGYHISKSGILKDSGGAPRLVPNLATGGSSPWSIDNSGIFARVGGVYYFSSPIKEAVKKGGPRGS